MKKIIFHSAHRQKHFDYFNKMTNPHFNITANVNMGSLLTFLDKNHLPFTPSIVYLISRAANDIKELRRRIRGTEVVEHESVHPSYTVPTSDEDVFSFCCVPYAEDAFDFIARAQEVAEKMKNDPSFEDEVGRDDFLFLSAIPWVSFTSFQHAMHHNPSDSVPRIVWGKYFEKEGSYFLPLSIQVHHAVVDGRHVGAFFKLVEKICANPSFYYE